MRATMGVYMPCDERVGAESEALPAAARFKPRRCLSNLSGRMTAPQPPFGRRWETTLGRSLGAVAQPGHDRDWGDAMDFAVAAQPAEAARLTRSWPPPHMPPPPVCSAP